METLKRIRLYRQHLTDKADKRTVVRDLNGLQAQFTVNSFHALKIRCNEELSEAAYGENLVKNWTVRGTVHVFAKDDLPLFCHGKERYRSMEFPGYGFFGEKGYALAKSWGYPEDFLRECQEKGCAWTLSPERQADWSAFIVRRVAEGVSDREELKKLCTENGMTKIQALSSALCACNHTGHGVLLRLFPDEGQGDACKASGRKNNAERRGLFLYGRPERGLSRYPALPPACRLRSADARLQKRRKRFSAAGVLFETVSERGRRAITEAAEACWKDIRSISWN